MSRWGSTVLLLAAIGTMAACPAVALADAGLRVVIVKPPEEDRLLREICTRLRAELSGAGFAVWEIPAAPAAGPADTDQLVGKGHAYARVSLDHTGAGTAADVWMVDLATAKAVRTRVEVNSGPRAAAVLAIRSLELLRASLLPLAPPPRSSEDSAPGDRSPPVAVTPSTEVTPTAGIKPSAGYRVWAGALAMHSFAGVGPALGPALRVSRGLTEHVFGRLSIAAPAFSPTIVASEGSATVTQQFVAVELGWETKVRTVGAYGWLGVGGYYLHTTGRAVPPYHSTSSGVLSLVAELGLGAVARLSPVLAATAEVGVMGLVPKPIVVIADREMGTAGGPSVTLSGGLSASF